MTVELVSRPIFTPANSDSPAMESVVRTRLSQVLRHAGVAPTPNNVQKAWDRVVPNFARLYGLSNINLWRIALLDNSAILQVICGRQHSVVPTYIKKQIQI